jgi:hypothetical protein
MECWNICNFLFQNFNICLKYFMINLHKIQKNAAENEKILSKFSKKNLLK